MSAYLVLVAMSVAYWRLRGNDRTKRGTWMVWLFHAGGAIIAVALLAGAIMASIAYIPLDIVAFVLFFTLAWRRVVAPGWLAADSARHHAIAIPFAIVYLAIFIHLIYGFAIARLSKDIFEVPPQLIPASEHPLFVGMVTHTLFGPLFDLNRGPPRSMGLGGPRRVLGDQHRRRRVHDRDPERLDAVLRDHHAGPRRVGARRDRRPHPPAPIARGAGARACGIAIDGGAADSVGSATPRRSGDLSRARRIFRSVKVGLRLGAVLLGLAAVGAFVSEIGQGVREAETEATPLAVWAPVAIAWLWLVSKHVQSAQGLWLLPSALFRYSVAVGSAAVVIVHLPEFRVAVVDATAKGGLFAAALDAALYELGVVALASLAAFAVSRSFLRPFLIGTRPPVGARDITLRTRFVVATTGAAFATAGTLLSVSVDFAATPPYALESFLATAAALVLFAAIIGWLVGDDAARGVEAVTRRMRELATARDAPLEMPVIAADEVGDLALAASELERRVRREEAESAARLERERVARELHDGVAKSVSVLALEVSALAAQAEGATRQRLGRIEHLARALAEELRAIVQDFRGQDREPFEWSLRRVVAEHAGVALSLEGDLERVDTLARFETLRILDEALRNAERHAEATRILARVAVADGHLRLVVEDDGKGLEAFSWEDTAASGHFGLVGIRERAALLDGELTLEPAEGRGTRLVVEVPLRREGEA